MSKANELVPPVASDSERALLGSLLLGDQRAYDRVAHLSANDFHDARHAVIWRAVVAMNGAGCDLLTVKEHLRQNGQLEAAGGSVYLSSLVDGIPDIARNHLYAANVRDAAIRRRAMYEGRRIQVAAAGGSPIADLAMDAAATFAELAAVKNADHMTTLEEQVRRGFNRLEDRMLRNRVITGIPSGIHKLDVLTLGFQRGVSSVVAARARVGKTSFAHSILINAMREGARCFYTQLDMSPEMTFDRLLSSVSGVDALKIRTGQGLDDVEKKRIARANGELTKLSGNLVINYAERDIRRIAAIARREQRSVGLDLIVVDHIGHLSGGTGEKRYLEIGNLSRRLIDIAIDTNAAVIVLSQLNREAETRKPILSDLRESGNLEQDARLVLLLDRPEFRGDSDLGGDPYKLCDLVAIVAKNEGETGHEVRTHFHLRTQRVSPWPDVYCSTCEQGDEPDYPHDEQQHLHLDDPKGAA